MKTIHKSTNKGFTLIEVILVITLIGILVGIVLISINPNTQLGQARNLIRKSHITDIYDALEVYNSKNSENNINSITTSYQEICDTGTRTINDSLPSSDYCAGKLDLRILVPNYIASIPKDNQVTGTGNTGYEVAKTSTNQISMRVKNPELGEIIAINPLNTTVSTTPSSTPTAPIFPSTTTKSCPAGYIAVPGNSIYATNDFCVMKYEAKPVLTTNPTVGITTAPLTVVDTIAQNAYPIGSYTNTIIASVPTGYPLANVNGNTQAEQLCSNNTGNGVSGASLINNAEWMTIARNIEAQATNWSGGAFGSGGVWRGHSDSANSANQVKVLEASSNDADGYFGTGNSVSNGAEQKRTHTLSTGAVIWDFAGNVNEYIAGTIQGKDQPIGTTPTGGNWREFTSITNWGTLGADAYRSSNSNWNISQNMGQIYSDGTSTNTTVYQFIRGGSLHSDTKSGIFGINLGFPINRGSDDLSFRCVIR